MNKNAMIIGTAVVVLVLMAIAIWLSGSLDGPAPKPEPEKGDQAAEQTPDPYTDLSNPAGMIKQAKQDSQKFQKKIDENMEAVKKALGE